MRFKQHAACRAFMNTEPFFSLFPPSSESVIRGVCRRDFVKMAIATGVGLSAGAWSVEAREGVPYRKLGKTGENVSMLGLGGAHIGQQKDPKESIEIIRAAIEG